MIYVRIAELALNNNHSLIGLATLRNKASSAADLYELFNEEGSIDGTVSFPAISFIYWNLF
jgi:hypothetical protein